MPVNDIRCSTVPHAGQRSTTRHRATNMGRPIVLQYVLRKDASTTSPTYHTASLALTVLRTSLDTSGSTYIAWHTASPKELLYPIRGDGKVSLPDRK